MCQESITLPVAAIFPSKRDQRNVNTETWWKFGELLMNCFDLVFQEKTFRDVF